MNQLSIVIVIDKGYTAQDFYLRISYLVISLPDSSIC